MQIDWRGILTALFITFILLFILIKTTEMAGFCLNHEPIQTACIANASDVMAFVPIAILIALSRLIIFPIIAFSVGMLYYFKGHPIEDWSDVILPSSVIGVFTGSIILIILSVTKSAILEDLLYLFIMFSWVGFFIAMAVACAIIGGLLTYHLHKKI
jgi:hypothetical protein